MCVLILSTTFVCNIYNSSRICRDMMKMLIVLYGKYPLFLSDFNEIWIFTTDFRKILISDFKKIRPVGAELFHAGWRTDGRTDMTKLIVAFRNFANAPRNMSYRTHTHYLESTSCPNVNNKQRLWNGY
jgi:hypothetical protein